MSDIPKMTIEASKRIPAGAYEGRIMDWTYTQRPAAEGQRSLGYADLTIAIKGTAGVVTLVTGYPVPEDGRLTSDSFLGRFLQRFGVSLALGAEVDVNQELDKLRGRDVRLRITMERKNNTDFSRIDRDSVKPVTSAA